MNLVSSTDDLKANALGQLSKAGEAVIINNNKDGLFYSTTAGMYEDVPSDSYCAPSLSSNQCHGNDNGYHLAVSHEDDDEQDEKEQEEKVGKKIGHALQLIHQMDAEKLKENFIEFVESLDTEHEQQLLSEFVGFMEGKEAALQRSAKPLRLSKSAGGITKKDLEFDR